MKNMQDLEFSWLQDNNKCTAAKPGLKTDGMKTVSQQQK
jgi:hypothetical protein